MRPFGLAISADGSLLASVNVQDDTVSIINTASTEQKAFKVGYHPYCAAFSIDEKSLYVTNTQDDSVTILNIETGKIISTINVGSTPEGISLDQQLKFQFQQEHDDLKIAVLYN